MDEEIEKLQQELEKLENLVDDKSEDRKNLESEFDKILKMTNMQSYFPNF
jgi:predicted RNase H-like nuclease (RuvC/YqgF family)